jgi:4'-phosphopantetheinyl transferase EntD
MVTDFRGALIGVLDARQLAGRDYAACLCDGERAASAQIVHPRRRQEWLAARILAKYLFLEQPAQNADVVSGHARLFQMSEAELAGAAPSRLREAEIVAGPPPRIGSDPIAISHTNGIACVSVRRGTLDALDIETRAERSAPFYEHNFTRRERQWAESLRRDFRLDRDWVYTLLWSMKECMLKAPWFRHLTVWDMPALEVAVRGESGDLRRPHDAAALHGEFVYLETEVSDGHSVVPASMAVTGTSTLVVTASRVISERGK